ncbi:MAG TPA: urate oxidase [Solirubrobacteraceae bacterium]|jgi:urate oxidase|nr:urate oxidase [Solirubrobacteraceae bacterium]
MDLILGANQYGKAQVRMVAVDRSTPVHSFVDLNVGITLSGNLEDVHRVGSNANVVPTDTQKNTVFAFARETPVGEIEEFGLRLARHFVSSFEPITRARVNIESSGWSRIPVHGEPHPHGFVASGPELRVAEVIVDREQGTWVLSGLKDLIVLKTSGSEFSGYIKDDYTTLQETDERILSTAVAARWRHGALLRPPGEWDASFAVAREKMLQTFAAHHSLSLQQTLFEMAGAAVAASPGLVEVRMSMPNRHHFVVDLERFGLDNPNLIYRVEDRPYGLIEAQILVPGAPDAGPAWESYPLL